MCRIRKSSLPSIHIHAKEKVLNCVPFSDAAEESRKRLLVVTMFDCYRTTRLSRAQVVYYDGCFVDTTQGGMNIHTGIFTVKDPGVYQLSFTAKYVSSSKGRFGAWSDIYVNDTVSNPEIPSLGNGGANWWQMNKAFPDQKL